MATTTAQPSGPPAVKSGKRDFRQEVTDQMINMLENGVAPWQEPWEPGRAGFGMPTNPTTEKAYRGCNAIHLMATALRKHYDDSRWMTYKQASDHGWQVRKGEKGTQIEFWEIKPYARERDGDRQSDGEAGQTEDSRSNDRYRYIHRVYTVFNAKQIEGIPAHKTKEYTAFEAAHAGEQILNNSGARISHDQADRAFYNRTSDSIHLPPKQAFKDAAGYYGTALHELAHWSGHPGRLNRQTLNESYRFGDTNYAKEELRAELASVFLAAERGIPHDPEQHAAYVGSWIKALKEDKNEIFRAAHDASAAADFLLALERDRSIADEQLAAGPAMDSETSAGTREAAYEQESANLERDREDLIEEPVPHRRVMQESLDERLLKQVAALTWESTATLAPDDLIQAAVQVRASGGTFLIHKNSYLSAEGITKAHWDFTEKLNALERSSETDWKTRGVAHAAGSSFSRLLAELGLPQRPESLELLRNHEPLISDSVIRSSFLSGFASDVRSRYSEQEEIYPGSPESIQRRAEREQFIQAMEKKLGYDPHAQPSPKAVIQKNAEFENTAVTARLEPGSRTVNVEDKETGTQRRSSIEMHGSTSNAKESQPMKNDELNTARTITANTLGESARAVEALVDAGTYRGVILGETERYLVQRQSAGMAVLHQKDLLDRQPQVGETFSINYSNGKGLVREARDRVKAHELGR